MAKQGAKTAMPRLRFREFGDKPKWPVTKLGSRGKFIGGGTPSRENAEFWMGRHPWISSSDVSEEDIRSIRPSRFITDEAVAKSATQAVPTGSVLIVSRVGVGKIAVTEEQLYTSQDFVSLVPSTDCPEFLAYLLKSRKSALLAFNQGMAIKGFTRDDIAGLDVPVPERAEQQKIANCLTSLDEVIVAQGRKVEALKAHKRGLMQQLFPREGETRPRLRFPEFRDAPEWRNVVLGDVSTIVRGGSPRPIDDFLTVEPDGLNWLKIGDVDREAKYITATEEKVRVEALSKTRVIRPGDFILSNSMSFGRPYISAIDACIHDGWIAVTRIHKTVVHEFLYYSILSERSQTYFANQAAGSGVQNLNKDIIKLLPVAVPSKREQQRIADCLASLDTRITAESNRLAAFKTHKQGLMQQLFPAPESV